MSSRQDTFQALKSLGSHKKHLYYSLQALEDQKIATLDRFPISLRILLESLLRHCDGKRVTKEDVLKLCQWKGNVKQEGEIPFVVARVLLQDFTGVPLLVDLAAMRDAALKQGFEPSLIEPIVPVDLIIDHSVQVDKSGSKEALQFNLDLEFKRNLERYAFLKWGEGAFKTFRVVPPGIGICHQVNLEYLASVVIEKQEDNTFLLYPDTLVGTDSHTTMINGLGIVGWGVGGIEAESAMLGQPVNLQIPEVVGLCLSGSLQEGVTATDFALRVTEMLRKEGVVNKFVEFYGEGVSNLTVADRATIANMAPEYGATMGFFPVDEKTLDYLRMTGRSEEQIALVREYLTLQNLFGVRKKDELDFTKKLELALDSIPPSVSGPKRPQDRISLKNLKATFSDLLAAPTQQGGYGKAGKKPHIFIHTDGNHLPESSGGTELASPGLQWSEAEMVSNRPFTHPHEGISDTHPSEGILTHGSIVIAAITSCTNTSNPSVMIAAGLLAKKAVERGIKINSIVKTSLAPGSRVVTDYLQKSGLQQYLDALGFQTVGYGCTTCIGNSGPLDEKIEKTVKENDIVVASVLSGNRNFEARIHSAVKANFLMSPPLVIAYAIAGRIDIDVEKEPLCKDAKGTAVFLKDLWPSSAEIESVSTASVEPAMFRKRYSNILGDNPLWGKIQVTKSPQVAWDPKSTYIQKPPYFSDFSLTLPEKKELRQMRCLALLGDSVTTDHISPAGAFSASSPAGKHLLSLGIPEEDFNSYGSRRGNHEVMMRGTFANVRIKNKMAEGKEGGFTKHYPDGAILSIFDASQQYEKEGVPLIVFAGFDYGMGSSRDWAAKGTALLGVKVVVARSFERIHRSNLIGMGVLPLEFPPEVSHETLGLKGDELFSLSGIQKNIIPRQQVTLEISRKEGVEQVPLTLAVNTLMEVEYFNHGGIMPYVLRQILC